MEWVDLSVTSKSVQPTSVDVLAADEPHAGAQRQRRAAQLLALAERTVRWEDDVTAAELQLYEKLYLEVLQQAARELQTSAGTDAAPLVLIDASIDLDRTALLELRARACALVQRAEQARRATRPRHPKRWRTFALAAFSFAVGALFASRDSLADTFDWGNVSRGKTWVASSRYADDASTSGVLGDFSKRFFFHTAFEKNPWLEVDLGEVTPVRSATVINRKDCCSTRVAPLVIETSNDRKRWHTAATQRRNFSHWRARLDTPPARYVRLRILRESNLHLKAFVVRK